MKLQMEGLERTRSNLLRYSSEIRQRVWIEIKYIGDTIVTRLKQEFPANAEEINGYQDEPNLTYTIYANNILVCSVTNKLILTEAERGSAYKGQGYFSVMAEAQDYTTNLINQYLNEARGRIQSAINIILN